MGKPSISLAQERLICIEVYKTFNSLNPYFMQELFKIKENWTHILRKNYLNLEKLTETSVTNIN